MVPRLEFVHLLWSYLPGFPLALCIYLVFASGLNPSGLLGPATDTVLTLYFIIGPLMAGLFLDGLRHILPNWFPSKWEWAPIPKDKLRKNTEGNIACGFSDQYIGDLCAQTALTYYMYEFFGNLILSLILCWVTLFFLEVSADLTMFGFGLKTFGFVASIVVIVLCYICMIAFVRMNNENIKQWFP